MHMADALISPAVGGTMWLASAGLIAWCARKVRRALDDRMIPLMGVLGAFVFAAMMVNFAIPLTGSSGHLGGGLILAILLGPYAAFLVIASVLTVQALFFADGGLLALGCNIFNLGFFPAFVAYPLIFRPLAGPDPKGARLWLAAIPAAIAGLQLGAAGVVMETTLSGISDLPFRTFIILMQSIHLAIGLVEGVATAAVVSFVLESSPEVAAGSRDIRSIKATSAAILIAALLIGGIGSWFASTRPDGLEWATAKTSGQQEIATPSTPVHSILASIQEKTAFLPDYSFKKPVAPDTQTTSSAAGTSTSGLAGGLLTLALVATIGFILRHRAPGIN